jgi:predicted nuclease of predicted toxin-antitoxin system
MKLLLDACVWPGAATELERQGHEVVRVCDFGDDPGDQEILALALRENRIIVTLDKDFGELAVAFGHAHAGIIRIVNFPISRHAMVCIRALEQFGDELARGAIVTAEPGRLRLRPPPAA